MVDVIDDGEMWAGEITTKKTMFGRTVFVFEENEYETEEAARSDRQIIINRRRSERKLQEEKEQQQQAVSEIYSKYDESPEIITAWVQSLPNTDKKKVLWGLMGEKETGLSAFVDMNALSNGIYEVCRDIVLRGYEVISITPVEAGVGAYQFPGGKVVGGAGWGYSFTQGVVITAKRNRELD